MSFSSKSSGSFNDNKNQMGNRKPSPYKYRKPTRISTTFRGGVDELQFHYYDCSSFQDADRYINTTKEIIEHIGRTYNDPGDIKATLDNMTKFVIPMPSDPAFAYKPIIRDDGTIRVTAREQVSHMEDLISRQEINVYVKRKAN